MKGFSGNVVGLWMLAIGGWWLLDIGLGLVKTKDHQIKIKKEREARRMNIPTEWLNMRKYARCEWKCME